MKRLIFIAILFPSLAFASLDRDLYFGVQNSPDVQQLQEFLTAESLYTSPITGNFFSLTQKAVKDFQTREIISPVSGYVGPKTRARINELLSPVTDESGTTVSSTITPPKTNDDVVAKLTEQLNALLSQVQSLQAQQAELVKQNQTLGAIQQQQVQVQETLQQIQQNTTPTPVVPPPPPPPPIDKSELIVTNFSNTPLSSPLGTVYTFVVSVLDKDGKYLSDVLIKMDAPDNAGAERSDYKVNFEKAPNFITNVSLNDWKAGFSYLATSTGTKVVTFSANGMSKSFTLTIY